MSDGILPALSRREWEMMTMWRTQHMVDAGDSFAPFNIRWNAGGGSPWRHVQAFDADERHALAALALHDQPFGFDFVDVQRLREIADALQKAHVLGWPQFADRLHDVADRIAALLPPPPEDR